MSATCSIGDAIGPDSRGRFFQTPSKDSPFGAAMSSCIGRRNYSSWPFKFILGNLSIFSENSLFFFSHKYLWQMNALKKNHFKFFLNTSSRLCKCNKRHFSYTITLMRDTAHNFLPHHEIHLRVRSWHYRLPFRLYPGKAAIKVNTFSVFS